MRWEYMAISVRTTGFVGGKLDRSALVEQMNSLGAEGWEAMTAFDTNAGGGVTRDVVVLFKRAVSA